MQWYQTCFGFLLLWMLICILKIVFTSFFPRKKQKSVKKNIFQAMASAIIPSILCIFVFEKCYWFYWVSCYQEPFLPSERSSSVQITNYHQIVSNLLIASESTRLIIREETAFKDTATALIGVAENSISFERKAVFEIIDRASENYENHKHFMNQFPIRHFFEKLIWKKFYAFVQYSSFYFSNELTSVFFCVVCCGNFLPRPPR